MSVVVYTRKTCAPCKTLKHLLTSKKINYEELDVDQEPSLMKEIQRLTGFSIVPTTVIDDQVVIGPNLSRIMSLLA